MSIRANSNSVQITQTESSSRTLSDPTGHCPMHMDIVRPLSDFVRPSPNQTTSKLRVPTGLCPVLLDFVRFSRTLSDPAQTLSGVQKPAQWLVPFELSINSTTPPTVRISWYVEITMLQAHSLYS
jgi:hypothetical protein